MNGPLRIALVLVAIGTAGCASPSFPSTPQRVQTARRVLQAVPPGHAMWMWTVDPYPPVDSVIAWAREHGVKDVFLAVQIAPGGKVKDANAVAHFAEAAKSAGIGLYALNGDPSWIANPNAAVAWETAVLATGAFAGVHLDVEPNQIPGWKAFNVPGAARADNPILREMYATIAALRSNSPGTHLEIDVQFSDSSYTRTRGFVCDGYGSFGEALVARTDEVTVMSYRTVAGGPNGVKAISAPMLALAVAHGHPMRLAIETAKDPADPQDSFYGRPESAVENILAAIDTMESSSPAYAGTSVEEYLSWSRLRP